MKIWVVNSEEPIPQLTGKGRMLRGGMLADFFSRYNHDIIWWCSTFLHYEKEFFVKKDKNIALKKNLNLKMIHPSFGMYYKKNISLRRILYCKCLANKFKRNVKDEPLPDVIYCAWPHIELAYECVKFGRKNNIPVLIDIRDFWPDNFVQPFSGIKRKIVGNIVEFLYGRQTRYVMKYADTVIGVVPACLDLASKYGRMLKEKDKAVYLSFYSNNSIENHNVEIDFLKNIKEEDFLIVYFGSIDNRIDQQDVMIKAAKNSNNTNVKFIICGDGEALESCREKTKNLNNIYYPGMLNLSSMSVLAQKASLGILPYKNSDDFIDSLPSKFAEYLSYGLPILTSLSGLSKKMIEENRCGSFYKDEHDLNDIIDFYYYDEELMNNSRLRALELFENEFNAEKVYKNLLDSICKSINK